MPYTDRVLLKMVIPFIVSTLALVKQNPYPAYHEIVPHSIATSSLLFCSRGAAPAGLMPRQGTDSILCAHKLQKTKVKTTQKHIHGYSKQHSS
jgi:hypothetical protein